MRRTWILCLLIALLPLRGWAMSAMAAERMAQAAGQMAGQAAPLPPCHPGGMDATADGASMDAPLHGGHGDAPASEGAGHHGDQACSHCAICHAALGPLSLPALPACSAAAVGELPPAWSGGHPPARAPDLPFKPPRG